MEMKEKTKQQPSDADVTISVVIPSYNSSAHIMNCLDSIYQQKTDLPYEVIVVDSSEEDICTLVHSRYPDIVVEHTGKRVYPGTARNRGVELSKGNVIAFVDSDCVVDTDWLARIYKVHCDSGAVVGGPIRNGYPMHPVATAEYFMEFGEFLPERKRGKVDFLPSCNFSIDRNVFDQVGGFPDYITSEDVLFSHALTKHAQDILFEPTIAITHFNRRSIKIFILKQKELGIGSCLSRQALKLKGHLFAKYRALALLVPFARVFTVVRKVLTNDIRYLPKLILTFPFIFLGLLAHGYGFWSAFSLPGPDTDD